jgi:hypothetical protein
MDAEPKPVAMEQRPKHGLGGCVALSLRLHPAKRIL